MFKNSNRSKISVRFLYIMLAVCLLAVCSFAIGLGRELYINNRSRSYYTSLTSNIETRPRNPLAATSAVKSATTTAAPGSADQTADSLPITSDEAEWVVVDDWLPYVDFDSLDEQFRGISAWIQLEGTLLDYPIMQWTDNSYFLSHLSDGTSHRSGSIFLDYRNNADFTDINTLIYGHTSRYDDMFGILKHYREQSFYEEHPVMYIFTPQADYVLELFAGYVLDSGRETPPMDFADSEAFEEHIADIKSRSVFRSDDEVGAGDRIVSLCTCAYDYSNARLVIVGKLVP